ncbi:MAG: hypothetical protein IIC51_06080 [Planctomycetes bacterium]|nr:hypothetical protein [Planctomycetota bacterium]
MITEIKEGKLFFDFEIGQDVLERELEVCRQAVEREINHLDHWCNGNNERNKWVQLYDIPTDHKKMHEYLQRKIKKIKWLSVKFEEPPTAPITYCYSGDSRICYHPHSIELNDKPWTVTVSGVQGLKYPMEIVIVLSYETVCFPIP